MFNGTNGAASAKDDFAHSAGERHERSMVHRTTTVKYAAVASSHSVALANGSQGMVGKTSRIGHAWEDPSHLAT